MVVWRAVLAVWVWVVSSAAAVAAPLDPAGWIAAWAAGGDAGGRPFAIVDKPAARIHVYSAGGLLVGSAPVLLGLTRGDDAVPGMAQRVRSGISVALRTTPAGRFDSVPGHNDRGEAVVWVDYGAAIAIHRLRPAPAGEQRPQRLASATPDDNRISLGCVVVDGTFYDDVVARVLGNRRGVIYVLPDSRHWSEQFPSALPL